MEFRIADTFTDALARLPAQDQKAAKTSAFDLQMDPSAPGLQFHRIDKSKDRNFWSMRVNRDIRIIVHKTRGEPIARLCRSSRRGLRLGGTPADRGASQDRRGADRRGARAASKRSPRGFVSTIRRRRFRRSPPPTPALFAKLSQDDLLSTGVPEDWIADVLEGD